GGTQPARPLAGHTHIRRPGEAGRLLKKAQRRHLAKLEACWGALCRTLVAVRAEGRSHEARAEIVRINSALVSRRPEAAAQLELRGVASPLDLLEPPVAVTECQRVATGAEVYSQRPFSARRRRTRSCGRSATRERRGSRGVTSRIWRPDSHAARSVPEVQKESAASGKVAPIPSTLRCASTSTGRCPE